MVNPEQVNSIKQGIEHYLDFKNNPYAQALGQLSGGGNQYRSPMEATRGSNPFDIARQNIQNKAQDSRSSSDLTPFDPILLQPFQHQDRYQADNFNPRDYEGNISRYTAADTWGKTFEKSFSDFGHKFKTSFTEGYETTGRILRSIFTLGHYGILPDEDEMMRKYFEDQKNELRNAIFLTPEAEDRFFNKKLLKDFIGNSGFAFGTIFEMGMEALLTWGVGAAISGGIKGASSLAQLGVKGATREAIKEIGEKTALKALPQSTADNAAMVVFSNSDEAVKGATRAANIKNSAETARRSVRESFNTMNNFFSDPNVAKNIYSKLGAGFEKYTPVLGNAITTVKDFNKARKLGASADKLFDIGYNGLRRSFVEFSAAASEATIESISAYGDMFTSLQQEFVDKNGRIPTPAEMEKMHSTAIKTASDVNALNMGVLLAMNKIQFGDLMQKWMPTSKYMKGFLNDEASSVAKTRLVKDGVKQKIYREGAFGVLGSTKKIAQDFGKKKAAWEVAKAFGKSTLRFEGSEGVQELIQEGGSHAIAEYNKSVYNSNPMSLADAFGEGVSSQWNEQGFKTFLIGAFTGRLVGAGKAVIDPLVEAASRLPKDKQEQYKEYIKQVDSDISTLNSFFENPSNSVLENVQSLKESMSASERLNKYAAGENAYRFNNAKDDAFVAAVKSARRLQATDALYDAIDSFGDNFTPEEFKEAFGIDINETEFTSVKDYASDIRNQVKSYVDTYDKLQQELGAKINPMFYADGSVEQKRARLIQHSLNQMIDVLAINSIKEGQSVKRLQNLSRELASDPEIGGSSEYVLRTLSDLSVLTSELGAISKEINDLKTLGDYESLLKAKELEELASAMKAFSPFFDPKDGTFIGTLSDETLKKDEISEEEIDSGMYNENVSALIEKIINGQNKRYNGKDISKKGLDKNFRKIVDYIRLNQDAKSFSKAIDAFYDPKTFEKLQHSFFDGTFKAVASSYLNQMQSPYSILKYAQKISEEQGLDLTEAIVEAAERIKNNPNVKELHAIYMSDTQSYELMEYIDTLLENFNNDITSKEEEADKKDPEKEAEVNAEEVAKDEEKKPLSNMEIETAPEEEKKTVLEQELSDEVDKTAFLKMMSDLDEAAEREGWSNIMDENNVYSDPSHPFNKFYNTLVGLYASEKVVYEVAVMNPNNSSEDLEAIRDDIFDKLDDEVIRRVKALYKELSAGNLRGPDSIYIPVAKTKPSTTFSDLIRDAKTPDEMWSILEKMDESGSNTPDLYEEWSKAFSQKFPENYTEPVQEPVEQPVQESVAESVFTEEQLDAVKGYISQILNVPKNSLRIIEVLNSEKAVQVFKDPANQNKSLKEVIDILLSKETPINPISANKESTLEKQQKTDEKAKQEELDPDLANIDPTIQAARNGDKKAQKELEDYGIEWQKTTTYRFVDKSEVDVLLDNKQVESKRGDADIGIDVTSSPTVTTAYNAGYRVTFKESFDKNNGLGKVKPKNENDANLEKGRGYNINDVSKIEKLDENGNVTETIYDAYETAKQEEPVLEGVQATRDETKVGQESTELRTEEATQEEIEAKKADIERRRQEELGSRVVNDGETTATAKDGEFKIIGDNRLYRINEFTGRPQVFQDGFWTNVALPPNLFFHNVKKSGWQKSKDQINAKYDAELAALEQQKSDTKTEIKPEVEELFDSNPELANQVYEALGFNQESNLKPKETYTINSFENTPTVGTYHYVNRPGKAPVDYKVINVSEKGILVKNQQTNKEKLFTEEDYFKTFNISKDAGFSVLGEFGLAEVYRYAELENGQPVYSLEINLFEDESKGKGLGKDIYKAALQEIAKKGGVLTPGNVVEGNKIWESFDRDGLVEKAKDKNGDTIYVLDPSKSQITPQQKQQALQLYSQYLDTIFPDSKVKDIVYHGSYTKIEEFLKEFLGKNTRAQSAKKGFFFSSSFKNSLSYIEDLLKQNKRLAFDGVMYLDLNNSSKEIVDKFYSYFDESDFADDFNGILTGEELESLPDEVKSLPIFTFGLKDDGKLFPYSLELLSYEDANWRLDQLSNFQIDFMDSGKSFEDFSKEYIHSVVLDIKNPLITSDNNKNYREEAYSNRIDKAIESNNDSVIIKETKDPLDTDIYVVFEPEQIHILGSKKDIKEFKNFVKNQATEQDQKESDNTKSDMDMTISDIQEKLNIPLENLPKAIAQRILDKDKNLRSAYMVLQEYLKLNDPLVDFNSWFNQNYMLSSDSDYAKNLLRDLETDMYERAYEYEELSNYSEQNVPGLTMVESFIHAYNVKVRAEDFDQYGDRNIRIDGGPEFNLKYIRSDARPLDAIAQELSTMFRFESQLEGQARGYGEDVITPQDIIDYIIERESDPDRFNGKTEKQLEKRRKEIERSVNAKEAYSIAMSLPILESSIDKLYRMRKLTTEQKDIIAEYIEYKLKNKGKRILPMPVENQEDTYLAKALSEDQGLDSIFTDNSPWKTDPLEKESSYLDEPSEAEPGEQLSFFSEGDTVLNNKGQKVAKTKSESDSKQLALNLNDGVSLEQAAQLYLKDSYDLQNALTFSKMMHIAFDKSDYETMSEFLLSKDGKKALKNVAKKILSANVIEQVFDSGVIQQETTTPSIESVATTQEKFSRSTLEAFVYSQEALKQIHLNLENTQESSNLSLEDSISKDLTEIFTCFLK